jgi:predicted nucleotidyltransferase
MDYKDNFNFINKNVLLLVEILNEKKMYLNELSEKSKISSKNNLLKNLNNLVRINILKMDKNKSNTFYSLNYDNLFTISILQLINSIKFENLPFEIKRPILETLMETKPIIAVLFGSFAKGNYNLKSDIDLLIVPTLKSDDRIKEIASRYGVKISPLFLKQEDLESKNDAIAHILKTGYPLIGEVYFYNELKKI